MFNNSPFTLCDNNTSERYKYYYDYAIKNLYDIKYDLEKQKTNNNKLKYKNKMLKEENKNLHKLIIKLSTKSKEESESDRFEFI